MVKYSLGWNQCTYYYLGYLSSRVDGKSDMMMSPGEKYDLHAHKGVCAHSMLSYTTKRWMGCHVTYLKQCRDVSGDDNTESD